MYHVATCFLYVIARHTSALTQTLTTSVQTSNGASIYNLSPTSVTTYTNWHITVNQDSDQWSLWLNTNHQWGFDATIPSLFSIQLSGRAVKPPSNLLISFADSKNTQYFTVRIQLNGQRAHLISPGCDNTHHHPTQPFIHGSAYLTMSDEPTPGDRMCRPAYLDSSQTCPYAAFGPPDTVTWPIKFTLRNYPIAGYSTFTFESDGYPAMHCGFGEAFPPNIGTNTWITALVRDEIDISSIQLNYTVLPQPSLSPSTKPSVTPTSNPTISPTSSPSSTESPIKSTTHNPTITPLLTPTLHLSVSRSPTEITEEIDAATMEAVHVHTLQFWERESSLPVLVAIAIAICSIMLMCMISCCVRMCKNKKRPNEYSHKMSFSVGRLFAFSRVTPSAGGSQRARFQSRSRRLRSLSTSKLTDCSSSGDSIGVPDPVDTEGTMVQAAPVVHEGNSTTFGRDVLYNHRKGQSTMYTDISSLYNTPTIGEMETPEIDHREDEKDVLYDEPSETMDGECTTEPKMETQGPKGTRLLHDTHGTSIELNMNETAVYEENESQEDYYVNGGEANENEKDDCVHMHTPVIKTQLSAINEQHSNKCNDNLYL